jgi:general secretion pathway protein D
VSLVAGLFFTGLLAAAPDSSKAAVASKTAVAARIYEEGRKAERAGRMARAYLLYSQAAALEPANQLYWLKSQAVQSRAALESPPKLASKAADPPATAAKSPFDDLSPKDRSAERTPQPPVQLQGAPGSKDFDLRVDAKALWAEVARAYQLETVFDGDYQTGQTGPPLHFEITEADYRQALHAAEAATGSFIVPISRRLFLVVKDTEQKRREMEPTLAASIPVPQAIATQELVEISQAVRQLFTLEHMAWDSQRNMVVMRDRVSRVVPARQVFEELVHHRPQVDIELELLEVDRSSSLAYGVDLPTTFQLIYMGTFWNSPLVIPSTISKLLTFGGGQTKFGIGIADATLLANLSKSTAQTLSRTDVHAIDGMPASIHVGDRYPVMTAGYFGPASSSQGGQVYRPPPSFSFEDLGVNVKVTPHIHGMDEVTLDVETEFKVLSGGSNNGIPIISSRKLVTKVRLRESEWGVVTGLMSASEARTIHGIVVLSDIPVLGQLLRKTNKDESTSEVLIIIKPTLLNLPPNQFVTPAIFTGSEMRPITPL